jgi:DNA-binding response OmpR family regulator
VREGLDEAGYLTIVSSDGARAFRLASVSSFALIVLDIMLPSMDGMEICRKLRAAGNTTPILMLTARDAVSDRVGGLETGADDYLCKPFDFDELLARVRALLRRDHTRKQAKIQIDDLVVDTAGRQVTRAGRLIPLTGREYALLEALATHAGQILSRESILERVFLDDQSVSNTVDVFIKNLRRKVDEGAERKLIHTAYGMGYVLRTEDDGAEA